jgi:RNA polymerase sigma-70 factor (ECF subfamily)
LHTSQSNPDNEVEIRRWLAQIVEDDQEAFARLLRLFWNKVYTQALTYLKSSHIAQELTQDVFLKVWTNRSKLAEVNNFSGYLFVMTRNEIISQLRKKESEATEPGDSLEEVEWIPDRQMEYKQSYATILKGIELLPPARQNVFKMSRLEGKTYDEIAMEMNISRNGVKDHVVKSLLFLRNYLRLHSDILPAIAYVLVILTFE